MFGWFKKAEKPKPEASRILPRIKNDNFRAALKEQGVPDDQMPILEPLAGDLSVTYAFDMGDAFMMVTPMSVAELGLRVEDLRDIAVANFRARVPNASIVPQGAIRRVMVGENLDACALLSTKLWTSVAAGMPAGVIAVAPHRDVLLFGDASSAEARKSLAMTAAVTFATTSDNHALSLQQMRWTGSGWAVDPGLEQA